jgi:hypothetical protein
MTIRLSPFLAPSASCLGGAGVQRHSRYLSIYLMRREDILPALVAAPTARWYDADKINAGWRGHERQCK